MSLRAKLEIGTRIWWDGQAWTVTGFHAGSLELRDQDGARSRIQMPVVVNSVDFRVMLSDEEAQNQASIPSFLESLTPEDRSLAEGREQHVLEILTGFRLGSPALALENEPRQDYDPSQSTLTQRVERKARELEVGVATVWRLKSAYEQRGLLGLVDVRKLRGEKDFPRVDDRVKQALVRVLDELTQESNITKQQILRRTRRLLSSSHPETSVPLPSTRTFNELIDRFAAGRGTFGAAKARRSIANRPADSYRHFEAVRPGETVLVDSTPLDAYALDPLTFTWVRVELTVAYDLFSGSILSWRFTPVSTKAVDIALLLYDIVRPKFLRNGWPPAARWAYVGLPQSLVIEMLNAAGGEVQQELAGVPFLTPEALVPDRGRVYVSRAATDACRRLGIDIQMARPYTPTDKAHIERLFRTIRENFVMNLKGYKGPDLYSRGENVESEAFFFIDEIEAEFARWVATYWQNRPHGGLELPGLPKMDFSPNEMYEEGMSRAGFTYVIPDANLYFELLPTEYRKINHYGLNLRGLVYNSEALDRWRNEPSPYRDPGNSRRNDAWPIRYDPRDLSEVYFYDIELREWLAIPRHGTATENRHFSDATLSYAKSLVVARGGETAADRQRELGIVLDDLLDRAASLELERGKERRIAAINALRTMEAGAARRQSTAEVRVDVFVEPDSEAEFYALFEPDSELIRKSQEPHEDGPVKRSVLPLADSGGLDD